MNKNYRYDFICFAYFREKLNLQKYEALLEKGGIVPYNKENVDNRISKYFSFLNEGNTKAFNDEERKQFDKLFSNDLTSLLDNPEVIDFIETTYQKYYFSNIKEKYKFYIPSNYEFMAPSDAITLGINYQKYDTTNENFDEEKIFERDAIINDIINEIQEKVSEEKGIKVAVLRFDELALNNDIMSL